MKYVCFLCCIISTLCAWSVPQNLGIAGADDTNPQAVRVQLFDIHTCLVWQTDVNGNWDIFSRFSNWTNWDDTVRITINNDSDINPSVAYDSSRDCYWCVWQNNSAGNWDIYVANGDDIGGWTSPHQVTTDVQDDEFPSVFVDMDTVWVVWQSDSGILSAFYDGMNWVGPVEIVSGSDNMHPKINGWYNNPFVVWESYGDIYYSEYVNGSWENPQAITADPHNDTSPEIATEYYQSVSVVWQSDRDGNEEIYCTARDTLDVHYRITFSDSADITPNPGYFSMVIRNGYGKVIAFSSNRNGNYDILTYVDYFGGDTSIAVDTNTSEDILPVMTGGDEEVWVLWQTDRNGDWDIYGCWEYAGGIEEANINDNICTSYLSICPNPFSKLTTVSFGKELSAESIELKIYNAGGRLVRQFDHKTIRPSDHIIWDGTDDFGRKLSSGVYFIRLEGNGHRVSQKVVKLK